MASNNEDQENPFSFFSFKENGPPARDSKPAPKKVEKKKAKPAASAVDTSAPVDPDENPFSFFKDRPVETPAAPKSEKPRKQSSADSQRAPSPPFASITPRTPRQVETRLPTPTPLPVPVQPGSTSLPLPVPPGSTHLPAPVPVSPTALPVPVPIDKQDSGEDSSEGSDRLVHDARPSPPPMSSGLPPVAGSAGDAGDLRRKYEEAKERARVAEAKVEKTMKILRQRDAAHAEERRLWESGENANSQQVITTLKAEVVRLKAKEKEDEKAMHDYMDKIEAKLQAVTQRATAAEAQVARLQGELSENGPSLVEIRKKAAFTAQQLMRVAENAEKGMRQMFAGMEDLRMAAATLATMEKTMPAE